MLTLATCYSSIQSYFEIYFILTVLFNVYFIYRQSDNHERFGSLTKSCL